MSKFFLSIPSLIAFCFTSSLLNLIPFPSKTYASYYDSNPFSPYDCDLWIPALLDSGVDFGIGYRRDSFDWNISGGENGPNILSELTWSDLQIGMLSFSYASIRTCYNIYFRAYADYGFIWDGSNQDSDFLGNNRTLEFSRSNNNCNGESVSDLSLGMGKAFSYCNDGWAVAPLVGISGHWQHLNIVDGFQTLASDSTPPIGPIEGLNSYYKARWYSAWLGVDAATRLTTCTTLEMGYEFHFAHFHGCGFWNLRETFNDFSQKANGTGHIGTLSLKYQTNECWQIGLSTRYQYWSTFSGTDRVFLFNEEDSVTKLNGVHWRSFGIGLDMIYYF